MATLNTAHLAHVNEFVRSEVVTIRKDRTGAVKVEMADGRTRYFFEGHEIFFNSTVSAGYYGRWKTRGQGFGSLTEAVASLRGLEVALVFGEPLEGGLDRDGFGHEGGLDLPAGARGDGPLVDGGWRAAE